MEDTQLLSEHNLKTDYSLKGKTQKLIIGWSVFLLVFAASRLTVVQDGAFKFAANINHATINGVVDFVFNHLWIVFIPMITGTFITLREKHPFVQLKVYNTGLGFVNRQQQEKYAPYNAVEMSHGAMQQSIRLKSSLGGIEKEVDYGWGEFTKPDVLEKNVKRYGIIQG